uniref:DUF4371 domain-containing protein n=1 Tax=Octopus bimaculoides TaxID=37653 RepID=A0A0L8G9Z5_OCTBM
MRPNKLHRHIETKHSELKDKPLDFFERMLTKLKIGQSVMQHYTKVNEKSLYVSYLISLRIAKTGKPHTIGETLVLPAMKDTVKYIWNFKPHEDMFFCEPVSRSTSDEIFNTVDTYIRAKDLDWHKCFGICTDGAWAMCSRNSGVVTRILELNPNASWTHCNLHRAALVSKYISDNFENVLNTSVKIVNFIKSKPLQSRLFEKLCEEMGSDHKSLLLHTNMMALEGKTKVDNGIVIEISEHLNKPKESFEFYFHEEMNTMQQNRWIMNPFQPDVTTGISTKADEELIDLSKDSSLKMTFNTRKLVQFCASLQTPYPIISTKALNSTSPFRVIL